MPQVADAERVAREKWEQDRWDASPMSGATLFMKRKKFGLTSEELGKAWGVQPRSIRRWEREKGPMPPAVAEWVDELERKFRRDVDNLVDTFLGAWGTEVLMVNVHSGWSGAVASAAVTAIEREGREIRVVNASEQ